MSSTETLAGYVRARMDAVGIDSIRGLAAKVGVAPETARQILNGQVPQEQTLRKIAEGLPASLPRMRELAGRPVGESEPFVLPPEADQLDERQRSVVLAVVHALLDASTAGLQRVDNVNNVHHTRSHVRLVGRRRDTNGPGI